MIKKTNRMFVSEYFSKIGQDVTSVYIYFNYCSI